jgi:hypothetical protein
VVAQALHFPRNEHANPAEYLSERPEMTPQDEKPRKAKTMKGNNTYENKINEEQY